MSHILRRYEVNGRRSDRFDCLGASSSFRVSSYLLSKAEIVGRRRFFLNVAVLLAAFFAFRIDESRLKADESTFEYRRVFVPEKDLTIISGDFVPIDIDDLTQRLKRAVSAKSNAFPIVPSRVLLAANLDGQALVSDASALYFDRRLTDESNYEWIPKLLALDTKNLFVYESTSPSKTPASFGVQPDGFATVDLGKSDVLQFAWSRQGVAEPDASHLRFAFDIPSAIDTKMMLRLPPLWEVEQASCPFGKVGVGDRKEWIESLKTLMPQVTASNDENWWYLDLDNHSKVELAISRIEDRFQLPYEQLVLRQRLDYSIDDDGIEVAQRFEIPSASRGNAAWPIFIGDRLSVDSLTINDESLAWEPMSLPGWIEAIDPNALKRSNVPIVLAISGQSRWTDGENILPIFELKNSFTVNGSGSINVQGNVDLSRIACEDAILRQTASRTSESTSDAYEFEWHGRSPRVQVDIQPSVPTRMAESISRLNNEPNALVATGWVTFRAGVEMTSSATIEPGDGWNVVSAVSLDRRHIVTMLPSRDRKSQSVELHFSPPLSRSDVTVEIRSRHPWQAGIDGAAPREQAFEGMKPFRLQDWGQREWYYVEPVGRFKVEPEVGLLNRLANVDSIPQPLRDRLPRISELWVFESTSETLPNLRFVRQTSPYSTQVETRIAAQSRRLQLIYRLQCTPLAGAVSSIVIDTPILQNTNLHWRQAVTAPDGVQKWIPLTRSRFLGKELRNRAVGLGAEEKPILAEDRELIRYDLAESTAETIMVEGRVDIPLSASSQSLPDSIEVALCSFPESSQQDGLLILEDPFTLEEGVDLDPWAPAFFAGPSPNAGCRTYRYHPNRLGRLQLNRNSVAKDLSVVDESLSQLRVFPDGRAELRWQGTIFHSSKPLSISIEEGWQLESCCVAGEYFSVESDPGDRQRWSIPVPDPIGSHASSRIEITFVGVSNPLQHRNAIEWPKWNVAASIIGHRSELYLPPSFAVADIERRSRLAWPTFTLSRIIPSVWWSSLRAVDDRSDKVNDVETSALSREVSFAEIVTLRWTSTGCIHFTAMGSQEAVPQLVVVSSESYLAESWLRVFLGFTVVLCLTRCWSSAPLLGLWIGFFCLLLVGEAWIACLQQLMLGWLMGTLFLIIAPFLEQQWLGSDASRATNLGQTQTGASPSSHFSAVTLISRMVLIAVSIIGVLTAVSGRSQESPDSADAKPSVPSPRPFSVLIPIDNDGKVTSRVAYVPDEVHRRLYQQDSAANSLPILTATDLQLLIQSEAEDSNPPQVVLVAKLSYEVQSLSEVVRWPLSVEQADFVGAMIDGVAMPLGSRLRWDEEYLYWSPQRLGKCEIQLTVNPKVTKNENGFYAVECNVIPTPFARAEILGDEIQAIETNALGRLSNPSLNRFLVDLGRLPTFRCKWLPARRTSRSTTVPATLATELWLSKLPPLVKTTLRFDGKSLTSQRLEVESTSAWQPISRNWGGAELVDIGPGSSLARRRYQLSLANGLISRDDGVQQIEIYWSTSETDATLLSLPIPVFSQLRVEEQELVVHHREDASWELDGLQNWIPMLVAPSPATAAQPDSLRTAYRASNRATPPFLRKLKPLPKPRIIAKTLLEFERHRVLSRTRFEFAQPLATGSSLRLELPVGLRSVVVRAGEDVILSQWMDRNSKPVELQVFLPEMVVSSSYIEVLIEQAYSGVTNSDVPLPALPQIEITDHEVHAVRNVDASIEFQSLERFEAIPFIDLFQESLSTVSNRLRVHAWSRRLVSTNEEAVEPERKETPLAVLPRYRPLAEPTDTRGVAVQRMVYADASWKLCIDGQATAVGGVLDGVLIDMPKELTAALVTEHRFAKLNSPETGREFVYLFTDSRLPSTVFNFACEIPIATGLTDEAATAVPEIRFLGDTKWQTWTVLPRESLGKEIRWQWSGLRAEPSDAPLPKLTALDERLRETSIVLRPTNNRSQIRLGSLTVSKSLPSVSLISHSVSRLTNADIELQSNLFFLPQGNRKIDIEIPSEAEVVAVFSNDSAFNFSTEPSAAGKEYRLISLPLASDVLPQHVRIVTKVRPVDELSMASLRSWFTRIKDSPAAYLSLAIDSSMRLKTPSPILESLGSSSIERFVVWDMLEQSMAAVAEVPLRERQAWWQNWIASHPSYLSDSTFDDSELSRQTNERRKNFSQRLQLNVVPRNELPILRDSETDSDRKYFLLESASDTVLRLVNDESFRYQRAVSSSDFSVIPTLLGWLAVSFMLGLAFVSQKIGIQLVWDSVRQTLQIHTWWMLVAMGLLIVAIPVLRWLGVSLIAFGFGLALRAFVRRSRSVASATRP